MNALNAALNTGSTKLKTLYYTHTHYSPIHPKRGASWLNIAQLGLVATSAGTVIRISALCAACANLTLALTAMIYLRHNLRTP